MTTHSGSASQRGGKAGALTEKISFCRICSGGCGTVLSIDAEGKIASIRGDKENRLSLGYACFKGLQAGDSHHGSARILRPLARSDDGTFQELELEAALDKIADRLRPIIDEHGPNSVALFCGNGAVLHATSMTMQRSFLAALGSRQYFTTLTIDQSAKLVSFGRLGAWAGGMPEFEQLDVAIAFGTNPLVSHSTIGFLTADPVKRMKSAKRRGLKLITIDPRMTETAEFADLALQPLPGWDPAICAAIIRNLIQDYSYDADFCARYVGAERMKALVDAVEPFADSWVEQGAGLGAGDIRKISDLLANRRGFACAIGATGPNMAPFSNLAQHLIDTINVVCGSFLRAGDQCSRSIVQDPFASPSEGVIGADRPWDQVAPSRIRGAGLFYGERLSGTLAEEILTPGEGQIKAMIVVGGDPATSLPDQAKSIRALQSLDLLVSIDPWLGPTAMMADFVLSPLLPYERADVSAHIPGYPLWPGRWAQYAPPAIDPPPGSDMADDWYFLWSLAKRLGLSISYAGKQSLDMVKQPTTDDLISIQLDGSVATLDGLKAAPHGVEHDLGEVLVKSGPAEDEGRFDVMPTDVAAELRDFLEGKRQEAKGGKHEFVLAARRMRDFFNSNGIHNQKVRARNPFNPAFVHPDDLVKIGARDGDQILIQSDWGKVIAVARADPSMRRSVVSLSHGWGGEDGSCVNRLTTADAHHEAINAMPHLSAIPVTLARVDGGHDRAHSSALEKYAAQFGA